MHDADIGSLDSSMQVLRDALERLRQRRDDIETSKRRYSSMLAPVRRLPFELLSEVFVLATETTFPSKLPKLTLGWVCSSWRRVACHTPQLWDRIYFYRSFDRADQIISSPLLRNVWLPRSGTSSIRLDTTGVQYFPRSMLPAMRALIDVSHRWYDVRLRIHGEVAECLRESLALPNLSFLRLEGGGDIHKTDVRSLQAFANATALRTVELYMIRPSDIQLPWDQLVTIRIECQRLRMGEFLNSLRACPRLRTFKGTLRFTEAEEAPAEPLRHDALQSMALEFGEVTSRGIEPPCFPWPFLLPMLAELEVEDGSLAISWDRSAFLSFLAHSNCSIRRLCLRYVTVETDILLEALSRMPTIESLSLLDTIQDGGEMLFKGLTLSPEDPSGPNAPPPSVLPLLQSLAIHSTLFSRMPFVGKAAEDTISSRLLTSGAASVHSDIARRRTRLRNLEIAYNNWPETIGGIVDAWREAGLNVQVVRGY